MFQTLLQTSNDPASLVLRLTLAAVLFPHGAQHLLGWFGGYGFKGTHGWMTGTLHIPGPVAAFAILFEFAAPFLLAVGLGGRAAALAAAVFLAVAASTHLGNG